MELPDQLQVDGLLVVVVAVFTPEVLELEVLAAGALVELPHQQYLGMEIVVLPILVVEEVGPQLAAVS
jgi:hypothetical protein